MDRIMILITLILLLLFCFIIWWMRMKIHNPNISSKNEADTKTDTKTDKNTETHDHILRDDVRDIFNKAESLTRQTYNNLYNVDTMSKVEKHIYDFYTETKDKISSLALKNIKMNKTEKGKLYLDEHPDEENSDIMFNLIKDSWISASEPGIWYILGDIHTNVINIIFTTDQEINSKEYEINKKITSGSNEILIYFSVIPRLKDSFISDYMILGRGVIKIDFSSFYKFLFQKEIEAKSSVNMFKNLFYYWDNLDNKDTPTHIKICHDTMMRNGKSFNIVKLNKSNIFEYLPELEKHKKILDKLKLAIKVDIYRVFLLYKYGGLYVDSDTILLKDPTELFNKLYETSEKSTNIEYLGFGCTGYRCEEDGYNEPSNGIMASRRGSYLMRDIREIMFNILSYAGKDDESYEILDRCMKKDYFMFGKHLIWYVLEKFSKIGYAYHHVDSNLIGTRDINGLWVTNEMLFSDKKIDYKKEDDLIFIVYYNSLIKDTDEFRNIDRYRLLNADMEISRFFRKALK